jgi:hypothetical protein
MDALAVLATLLFFAAAAIYARALDQLGRREP